jgi:integrase
MLVLGYCGLWFGEAAALQVEGPTNNHSARMVPIPIFVARMLATEIDGLRIHDLRHMCASLAISAGANVKVVQKLLGHRSEVLTLDKYGHLFPDDLKAVATAFDAAADPLRTATVPKLVAVDKQPLTWWWQVQDSNL